MTTPVEIGQKAIPFDLPTDQGENVSLEQFKGQHIVFYFYPKDSTPGCTTQAKEFSALKDAFAAENCVIIGASKDSLKRHENFRAKQELTIHLASDVEGDVIEAYGSWILKKLYGKEYMGIDRSTFLIDDKGIVQEIWRKVRVKGHVDKVLERVKELNAA